MTSRSIAPCIRCVNCRLHSEGRDRCMRIAACWQYLIIFGCTSDNQRCRRVLLGVRVVTVRWQHSSSSASSACGLVKQVGDERAFVFRNNNNNNIFLFAWHLHFSASGVRDLWALSTNPESFFFQSWVFVLNYLLHGDARATIYLFQQHYSRWCCSVLMPLHLRPGLFCFSPDSDMQPIQVVVIDYVLSHLDSSYRRQFLKKW